jgi:Fe-S-cluster containining protein
MLKTVLEDGRVFIDMPSDDTNPCLNCGACCSHFRISFYSGETDALPGGFVPDELVTPLGPFRVCMKGTEQGHGRCVALLGEIGQSIGCAIYANRPTPCREFPVWEEDGSPNPACQRLRTAIGLPLLQPLPVTATPDGDVA